MVDDMLTLARADASGLQVEVADLYLDELLAECVRDAAVLACERGVEVRCANAVERPFRGDERLLRQMLMNLLDNAIRHTPREGAVEACLTGGDGVVEIAVSDGGPGVPPEDRERIFERFVRVDAARSRAGGAGLGLPIARCIAEAHWGTLSLERSGPAGSTFIARLPAVIVRSSSVS
jgi:signal transduction histidine kinase